jgi:hypothetical protein
VCLIKSKTGQAGLKGWVTLVLFCLFTLPFLLKLVAWSGSVGHQMPEEVANTTANLVGEAVTPWWLPVLEFLAGLGGLGAILLLLFLLFLKWAGEM